MIIIIMIIKIIIIALLVQSKDVHVKINYNTNWTTHWMYRPIGTLKTLYKILNLCNIGH